MTPKVSIIIPIYKVEKYIEKCVRSLFEQTLDDLEYVFVDDCSPDKSIEILENVLKEYPHRKNQVKIIRHKENKGVSQSRQDGLDNVRGEYVIHCDPDDWLERNAYELMYNQAISDNADMVICDYFINEKVEFIIKNKPLKTDYITIIEQISGVYPQRLIGATWNKLIKSQIAKSGNFIPGLSFCEDVTYLYSLYKNLTVTYLPQPLYHYFIIRESSNIKNFSYETLERDLYLINSLQNFIPQNEESPNYIKAFIADIIISRFFRYKFKERKKQIKELQKYLICFNYNHKQKKIVKNLAFNAIRFNYDFFSFLFWKYEFLRKKVHKLKYHK